MYVATNIKDEDMSGGQGLVIQSEKLVVSSCSANSGLLCADLGHGCLSQGTLE